MPFRSFPLKHFGQESPAGFSIFEGRFCLAPFEVLVVLLIFLFSKNGFYVNFIQHIGPNLKSDLKILILDIDYKLFVIAINYRHQSGKYDSFFYLNFIGDRS